VPLEERLDHRRWERVALDTAGTFVLRLLEDEVGLQDQIGSSTNSRNLKDG
jgi:hypothetical protein